MIKTTLDINVFVSSIFEVDRLANLLLSIECDPDDDKLVAYIQTDVDFHEQHQSEKISLLKMNE